MNKGLLAVSGLCCFLAACAPAPPVINQQAFHEFQHDHELIAIVPFNVSIMLKNFPDGVTPEQIDQLELLEGSGFQEALYARYISHPQDFTVGIQAIEQTNTLLTAAGIQQESIYSYGKAELAAALGVDAVISGWIERSSPQTEGEAARSAAFAGFALPLTVLFPGAPTNSVGVTMNIHDGDTGKLAWGYSHILNGRYGSSSATMAEALADQIGNQFPYRIAATAEPDE
jgi:hypothetical protein